MQKVAVAVIVLVVLASTPALAGEDAEGCRDSTVLTRMPGCTINECDVRQFDHAKLQVSAPKGDGEADYKTLDGKKESLYYACPEETSNTQIARNAENALKSAGYRILFSGQGAEHDGPAVTAFKGPQWVMVETSTGSDYWITTLRTKEMEQYLEVTASSMEDSINKTGHVAVYGINFDTGRATLKADSEKVLNEILNLLRKNVGWKMKVEGHTDNVGGKAANKTLSEQRAASVVAWLVKNGIDKSRLVSEGFGDTKPVADNASEQGRAKNRRVELTKM